MATTRSSAANRRSQWFDIAHVGKSPSRFDLAKLQNLNGHYLREADDARLAAGRAADDGRAPIDLELLAQAMPVLKVRAKDLNELAANAAFLFAQRPLSIEDKAAALLTEDARALLGPLNACGYDQSLTGQLTRSKPV
jgi:glutamyl-tRNA synthetase